VKAIKVFGLAALTALMAMAFVGASSANAEALQLCGHDGAPCEAIHHVHEESVGKAKILTSLGTTECNVLFLGDVLKFGSPIEIDGKFTYSNCELAGSSCTTTEETGPAELPVVREGHETASVTYKLLIHLVCGKTIDCLYIGSLKGTAKGPLLSEQIPDNGEISLSGQEMTKEIGGFLCAKTAKLDITTSPLWPVYISEELLGYCVQTEHKTGLYTDSKCETLGNPLSTEEQKHAWTYALVFAPAGSSVGEVLCYGTLLPYGLWEARDSLTGKCLNDNTNNTSLYENGTIKTVE